MGGDVVSVCRQPTKLLFSLFARTNSPGGKYRLKAFLCDILGAADKDNELSKARGDASVKIDDIAKIMAAGAHANVKYTRPGAGRNENDGQSLMKKKQKHDSALCLGKAQECLL